MRQLTLPSLFPRKPRDGEGYGGQTVMLDRRRTPARRVHRAPLRRRAPRWLAPLLRPVGCAMAATVALAMLSGAVIWRHGGFSAIGAAVEKSVLDWTAEAGISVGEVLVEGRREISADQVLAALDVSRGSPLLAFSPARARERLLALGWVADARVERRLPGTIFVSLTEREPAAIWQHRGRFALVDRSGAVIGSDDVARYGHLRLIVGENAPAHFAALFEALESAPEITRRVEAAIRVGDRRWNLQLDNGVTLLLPEHDVDKAWIRFAHIAAEGALLQWDVARVDLRKPDRLSIRLSPEAAQQRRDRGA